MGQFFVSMLCAMRFGIFLFFAAWVAVMTACVAAFLPETKGVPLEEVGGLWRTHWFWGRVLADAKVADDGGSVAGNGAGGGSPRAPRLEAHKDADARAV